MKFAMGRIIAAIFLCSASTYAHEIGTTRVSVVFQQGASYEIDVVTDAASLAEKLQALSFYNFSNLLFRRVIRTF